MRFSPVLFVSALCYSVSACDAAKVDTSLPAVTPVAETIPVGSDGDAADDPAIWVNADDPSASLIIGTDKKSGLAVYDVSGKVLGFFPVGKINNVDLRADPKSGAIRLIASNRSTNTVDLFNLDPATPHIDVMAQIPADRDEPYGACMMQTGPDTFIAFVTFKDGEIRSWDIDATSIGVVSNHRQTVNLGHGQMEGCVVDEAANRLFVGLEEAGIAALDPLNMRKDKMMLVDRTGAGQNLTADVEGLAVYYGVDGQNYLIASSQGDYTYAIYDAAPPYAFKVKFRIAANEERGIDGAEETDGLEVTSANLGPDFPMGMLVVQDGFNTDPEDKQNFKIVDWRDIDALLQPSSPK